jgi:hypothetical protein
MLLMSNSSVNQINVSNASIYRLDFINYMLSCDVSTETQSSTLIDMSNILENDTKIICSNSLYSKFKQSVTNRTNKNIGSIKFYSYCGGKELTRMITNSSRMSNLPYPPYSGSLFSSIILPELNDNDTVYLILDEYKDIESITCPLMKKKLIGKDLTLLFNNIKSLTEGKNIKFTIIYEKAIFEELTKSNETIISLMETYGIDYNHDFKSINVVCNYVCDLVFGRVFGGKTHEFTGVINPESFTIIDLFCSNNIHTFTNRTSGLSISGNGTSTINILMKCNSELTTNLKVSEIVTGKELLNINLSTSIKVHKNSEILLKLISLYNYDSKLENILKEDSNKIKEFIKENVNQNFDLEYNFLDNYDENDLEEDIKNPVHSSMIILYNRVIMSLDNIRKLFTNKRKPDIVDNHAYVQRGYTVLSTPGIQGIVQSAPNPIKLRRSNEDLMSLPLPTPISLNMGRQFSEMSPTESW